MPNETPPIIDHAAASADGAFFKGTIARIAVAIVGISLPYLSRIPGMQTHGVNWMTKDYIPLRTDSHVALNVMNALVWVPIVAGSFAYRSVTAVFIFALLGFAFPFWVYASFRMTDEPGIGLGLAAGQCMSVPLLFIAWLAGMAVNWVMCRETKRWEAEM